MTKREKIMIGTGVSAVILMSFNMFFYQPERKRILRLQGEIKTAGLEVERITRAIPGLRKLEEAIATEQKSSALVRKIPSGEKSVPELLRQLAVEASSLDMDVISLGLKEDVESPQNKSRYKGVNIVIHIQCPYRHLSSYLKRLEELPGMVAIDEIDIVRDNLLFPKVKVKLTLKTFMARR